MDDRTLATVTWIRRLITESDFALRSRWAVSCPAHADGRTTRPVSEPFQQLLHTQHTSRHPCASFRAPPGRHHNGNLSNGADGPLAVPP